MPICRNPFELFRDADKRTSKAILIIIARLQIKRTVLPFAIRPRFRSNNKIRKQNNALTPKITAKRTPSEPHPQRRSADIYFFGKLTLSFSGRGPGSTLFAKRVLPERTTPKTTPPRPAKEKPHLGRCGFPVQKRRTRRAQWRYGRRRCGGPGDDEALLLYRRNRYAARLCAYGIGSLPGRARGNRSANNARGSHVPGRSASARTRYL